MIIDWIVSLASLLVSVVAIVISIQQTRLSNKQQLFEKRATKYIEVYNLINNCKIISLNQKMIIGSSDLIINYLLSPLPATGEDKQLSVVTAYRYLRQSAVEISLLWKGKKFKLVEEFLNFYAELLIKFDNYNFCCELIKADSSECISREIENRLYREAEDSQIFQHCNTLLKLTEKIEQYNLLQSLEKSIRL